MVSNGRLRELNPKDKLVKKAKKKFGTTYDCREAGYILEDGTMLDFSGKKEGGTPKTRSLDHREVTDIVETEERGMSGDEGMDFFERQANAMRFGTYGTFKRGHDIIVQPNTPQKPTDKQWQRLEWCCRLFNADAISYDIYGEKGDRVYSGTKEKPKCKEAVNQLKGLLQKAQKEEKR